MNKPTAPFPESVLSAVTVVLASKLIWVSLLVVAYLLEFIAKPTTVLSPIFARSEPLNTDFTLNPDFKFTFALWTDNLLVKI